MPKTTLTSKGQVTIPKVIRERFGLNEGDTLEFIVENGGRIVVRPGGRGDGVCGVLREYAPGRPVTVDEMQAAVKRRAKEKASSRKR
jgi:antitoxin PrlF